MKVTGDWLTNPATQAVCAALTNAGYKALFVGGCVRNALIGGFLSAISILQPMLCLKQSLIWRKKLDFAWCRRVLIMAR